MLNACDVDGEIHAQNMYVAKVIIVHFYHNKWGRNGLRSGKCSVFIMVLCTLTHIMKQVGETYKHKCM